MLKGRLYLKRTLEVINLSLAALLVLSAYTHKVDPNDFVLAAFAGLGFVPLLFANMIFIAFWIVAKPKIAAISALALLLSWGSIAKHISFNLNHDRAESNFSIMSYNVRLFDLYNWTENKTTRNEIFEYLKTENPDIICFQEFFNTNDPRYFATRDTLIEMLSANNVHDEYTSILHNHKSQFGIATFSKYPIVQKQKIQLDTAQNNVAIYTDLKVGNDTLRVFNIHLASVHISSVEKKLSKHIEDNDQNAQINDVKTILSRLSSGFKRRAKQVDVIRQHIASSPHPVIVCGDLNDTPSSHAYHVLSVGLNDAFCEQGNGFGTTYLGIYPLLRIDYLLTDTALDVVEFSTTDITLSDHRPLTGRIRMKEPNE